MTSEELEAEVSELARRLSNVIRYGRIVEVDLENALVRVQSGDIKTDWLPFFARGAGPLITWEPPALGEQCLIFSAGGDLSLGCVLRGLYSATNIQPETSAEKWASKLSDGLSMSYDSASHTLSFSRKDGLKFEVKASIISFETDKAEIKNSSCNLIPTLVDALGVIAGSKTPTMMGDRESIDNAVKIPPLKQKLETFIG